MFGQYIACAFVCGWCHSACRRWTTNDLEDRTEKFLKQFLTKLKLYVDS